MKTTLLAVTLTALSFLYWPAVADAQTRIAKGTLSEIGGSSVTVQVAGTPMTFSADKNTEVENRGAGTKTRQAVASGKAGPQLSDVLKVGQSVAVTYREVDGKPYASVIKGIPTAGTSASGEPSDMRSSGTVKVIAGDSITIVGAAGGGGSFTQTFVVSPTTKVIAKGAGTAAAANGGRAAFTDLIKAGDKVSVTYHKAGNALEASDVRITTKSLGSN